MYTWGSQAGNTHLCLPNCPGKFRFSGHLGVCCFFENTVEREQANLVVCRKSSKLSGGTERTFSDARHAERGVHRMSHDTGNQHKSPFREQCPTQAHLERNKPLSKKENTPTEDGSKERGSICRYGFKSGRFSQPRMPYGVSPLL